MTDRLQRFLDLMRQHNIDAAAINPGPTFTYLTGMQMHLMERPTVLLVARSGAAALVLPQLEQLKLAGARLELKPCLYPDNPATWQEAFSDAFRGLGLRKGRLALEPRGMRYLELTFLQSAAPECELVDGSLVFENLRLLKNQSELDKMQQAAQIAQKALLETLKTVRPGQTEKQIAAELVIALYRAGSDIELPFQPIVSSGENSANPHASPGERTLREGDLLLFDWGASVDGYFSDITRTFMVGKVDAELERIGAVVRDANAAGRAAARPGVPASAVDTAARGVITDAGFGEYFTHRTGHGLGMEAHEAPYIRGDNTILLDPGMVFTVEPGIYLPGLGGVRIEDDMVISQDDAYSLTNLPRDLLLLNYQRD
ncbi:MAG TPA: Xaa-Pro peptidase family protein [Anaerolineaceae bacterium]|nr:Xaa-Pro peptidase family protein [Anaerolineaceae bacterium]